MRRFFGCLVLPLLLVVACVAGFYAWWQSNTIRFPEQQISIYCQLWSVRRDRTGDYEFPGSKEMSCWDDSWGATSDIYGYNPTTGGLLYIKKLRGGSISEIIYYAKPNDLMELYGKLVLMCGGRKVEYRNSPFGYQYAFPCTDEVALIDCGQRLAMLTAASGMDDHFLRYKVRCGGYTAQKIDDYLVEAQDNNTWKDVTEQSKQEELAAHVALDQLTARWSNQGQVQAAVATSFLAQVRQARIGGVECEPTYASYEEQVLAGYLADLLKADSVPGDDAIELLENYLDDAQDKSRVEYVECLNRKVSRF